MLYYGGSDWLHFGWRNGFLCLASLRPDGFAGYVQENLNQEGLIVTKSFKYKGGALKLTADVEKGGSVTVSLLNSDGEQIAASESITNSISDEYLKFDKEFMEENISIKIKLTQAKVYSFSIE